MVGVGGVVVVLSVLFDLCGGGGVKKVYFRCGWGWECGVVLSVLFDLREHIQNLNVFFFCCYIIFSCV